MNFSSPGRRNSVWIGVVMVCALALLLPIISPRIIPRVTRRAEALEHFDGVLDRSRQTYDAALSELYVRASRSLTAGDGHAAEVLYRQIVAKYPADPAGFEALGACLSFQGKQAEARAEYLHAMELDPQSVDALYGLGCVAYTQGLNTEAKEYLEKALLLDQKNALCHRVLGCVYEQLGDVSQAVSHYERAIFLDPTVAGDGVIKQRLKELKRPRAGSQSL